MLTNVADTSIAAYHAVPAIKMYSQHETIVYIVTTASQPLSLREIKAKYDELLDGNIDVSTVSARVNKLVEQGRLERRKQTRQCRFSGVHIHPIGSPMG